MMLVFNGFPIVACYMSALTERGSLARSLGVAPTTLLWLSNTIVWRSAESNAGQRGTRVLAGNITRAQQAIAVPKANTAALAYVTAFIAGVKKSGFVAGAIRQTGLTGASVGP
jgi:hypothetical protein